MTPTDAQPVDPVSPQVQREAFGPRLLLGAVLAGLIFAALVPAVRAVTDADIFWHLATGRWIAAHHTLPTVDPFSQVGQETGARWIAYSWLFELPVYWLYQALGWVGVVVYTAILAVAVTVSLFYLVARRESRLAVSGIVTVLSVLALWPLFTPRPWLLSLLFFLIECRLLLDARAGGSSRRLGLLLPLFALWANVHIQYVYGLFLIGLFLLESLLLRLSPRKDAAPSPTDPSAGTLSPRALTMVLVGSFLATWVNPYGWELVRVIREYALEAPPPLQDLSPPDFRAVSEWIVTGLGTAAVLGAGIRHPRRPFFAFLAAVGLVLFLRSRRDAWFSVALALSVLAETRPWPRWEHGFWGVRAARLTLAVVCGATLAAVGFLLVDCYASNFRNAWHRARQSEMLPVAAAAFLREAQARPAGPDSARIEGPLFNSFDWGGYLIWALPELPVAIDGRTNLHGPARLTRAWITLEGRPGWDANPDLIRARTVLVEAKGPLAALLRADPRYATAYEDSVAAVFVSAPH